MPPPIRLAGEAALLVFVAVGLALAGFSSIVIAGGVLGALVFVAAFERFSRKATTAAERPVAKPQPPTPGVPTPEARELGETPAREWNLWELQRAVRDSADERREEWNALLIHLREFANADGDLPPEFDGLVRESFAGVLTSEREPAATA
jgi:hypothetical protein